MAVKKPDNETQEGKQKVNCTLPGWDRVKAGEEPQEVAKSLEDELSPEHDRFCREYILDDNQTRSYMRAYPESSYGAAAVSAHQLLKQPKIIARVKELRDQRNKRLEISADKVLKRLEARASVNLRDLYKADGSFIPPHELDPDVAIGIKSVEVVELYEGQGNEKTAVGLVRKITLHDGKASDELLGRNLKLWNDVGSKNNPLSIENLSDEQLEARLAQLRQRG